MNMFHQSFETTVQGVKKMFAELRRKHPEPEHKGLLDTCGKTVKKFCDSKPPTTMNELHEMEQEQTKVISAISFTANALRNLKRRS